MPDRKKILLIYTGGTIGMLRKPDTDVYVPFDFNLIESQFTELGKLSCEIVVSSFNPPLDSSNIKPPVWIRLGVIIRDNYDLYDGFVVLHGTDTMAYTGSALSFILEGLNKPVILTGSQLPIGAIRTDAKENVVTAVEIAAHPETPIREVAIYFDNKVFRANRTKKVHADSFGAFGTPNFRPIGIAGVSLKFFRTTPDDAFDQFHGFHLQEKLETRVALLKFFPGILPQATHPILTAHDIHGIIIESYGSGNLPTDPALIESIRQSVTMGKIVLNITQCIGGTVKMGSYATSKLLLESGVLGGGDLTIEAALTKMMYLMGKYDDIEKVKYFMVRNIRGEMTAERAYSL